MNTPTHNFHNLAHFGLRGHEHHQRVMRNERLARRAGTALVFLFLLLGVVAACAPLIARADTLTQTWRLTIGIYSTAEGHTGKLKSYRDIIRIPAFKSAEACEEAGRYAQDDFLTRPDSRTMTNDLLDYACNPEG